MNVQAAVLVLTATFTLFVSAPAAAQTGAVLTVTNGMPQASNVTIPGDTPLMLLRQSFAQVLKQGGLTVESWSNACRLGNAMCAQGIQGVATSLVAATTMQGTQAKFNPVPAGTYYVVALGNSANDPVVWDVKVDLRTGANELRLDQRNLATAPGGGAGLADNASAPPAPSQTSAPRNVDPSIAKARAAKVDTNVFGIPLGEPLRLPTCELLGGLFSPTGPQADPTCTIDTSPGALLTAFSPIDLQALQDKNVATIQLNSDSCPAWMSSCTVNATLREGNLVRVELTTKGRGVEQTTGTELRGKYGSPTSSKVGSVTPDVGNPFTITDLVWSLPGLHVEFQPVRRLEGDDTRVRTTEGLVRIETEQSYQERQGEIKLQSKPKL